MASEFLFQLTHFDIIFKFFLQYLTLSIALIINLLTKVNLAISTCARLLSRPFIDTLYTKKYNLINWKFLGNYFP